MLEALNSPSQSRTCFLFVFCPRHDDSPDIGGVADDLVYLSPCPRVIGRAILVHVYIERRRELLLSAPAESGRQSEGGGRETGEEGEEGRGCRT